MPALLDPVTEGNHNVPTIDEPSGRRFVALSSRRATSTTDRASAAQTAATSVIATTRRCSLRVRELDSDRSQSVAARSCATRAPRSRINCAVPSRSPQADPLRAGSARASSAKNSSDARPDGRMFVKPSRHRREQTSFEATRGCQPRLGLPARLARFAKSSPLSTALSQHRDAARPGRLALWAEDLPLSATNR